MELEIYWTDFSSKELESIFDYYRRRASLQIAKKIVIGIYDETLKLKKQPLIGQVEELLNLRQQNFRYLLFKNYKIIYWINKSESRIEIVDVFDTRQNPIRILRNEKD